MGSEWSSFSPQYQYLAGIGGSLGKMPPATPKLGASAPPFLEVTMQQVFCPYCDKPAELVGGEVIYPHRPDLASRKFWHCSPCNAYVGTHKNSNGMPLGRLANAQLRGAKMRAHAAFDPLWKRKMARDGCTKGAARGAAYKWLATKMGIPPKECHIGMFNIQQCDEVVTLCNAMRFGR